MALSHKDFKQTVSRPFHIQSQLPNDAYREGWDRIFGKRKAQVLQPDEPAPTVEGSKATPR